MTKQKEKPKASVNVKKIMKKRISCVIKITLGIGNQGRNVSRLNPSKEKKKE